MIEKKLPVIECLCGDIFETTESMALHLWMAHGHEVPPYIMGHPFTCGLCSWGHDGAYHDRKEYDNHMAHIHPDEWPGK